MAQFDFKLPDIGEGVVEGEIVKWPRQGGRPDRGGPSRWSRS